MESKLTIPVIIIGGQLHNRITANRKILCVGCTCFIRGVVTDVVSIRIRYPESPPTQMIACVGGFLELDTSVMGIGKSDCGSLIRYDFYFLYCGIELPVRVICGNFLCVQSTGPQTGNGDGAIRSCGKGRTRYRIGTSCIKV